MKIDETWERVIYDPFLWPKVRIVGFIKIPEKNIEIVLLKCEGNVTSDQLPMSDISRERFISMYRKVY